MNTKNQYNRREFLKTSVLGLAGGTLLSACSDHGRSPPAMVRQPEDVDPVVDPASLEKPDLTLGFVPVNDCIPFAVAYTKGFFKKYGLNVRLSRESSWAASRDGVIFGRLDAAPVVSGAVVNARNGAEGARPAPLCAAMTIHRHGNAITMNRGMWDAGVRPLHEYHGDVERMGRDIRAYFQALPPSQRTVAVVLSSAIYEYFIRYLLTLSGMNPRRDFRIVIIPPPQMVTNMRIGAMSMYMVAEPWNTRAIVGNEGVGFTFAHGAEIWRGHPDRLLAVMESFIERYPKTYRSLVKAMVEACRWADRPENREEIAELASLRAFTGPPAKFTRPALVGEYNYGGFDDQPRIVNLPDATMFFELPDRIKGSPRDHSTFLWQSDALWLMSQAALWKQTPGLPSDPIGVAKRAWRTDLYREIVGEIGIQCPEEAYKTIPGDLFIDKRPFDPFDLEGYISSFSSKIH
ncbi:MAG: ABC transporter substrate-binding protein [Verrucomicrobia bacterium]|nr:ABC transporter substrate-binding protein [Verrucomicrobiota bacterium]MCH8514484.1 ABC transporter substrate-binding protein [Kiritimatiellia bacterium]